jgi:hypothetical protein
MYIYAHTSKVKDAPVHAIKEYGGVNLGGSGSIAPLILSVSNRWGKWQQKVPAALLQETDLFRR